MVTHKTLFKFSNQGNRLMVIGVTGQNQLLVIVLWVFTVFVCPSEYSVGVNTFLSIAKKVP